MAKTNQKLSFSQVYETTGNIEPQSVVDEMAVAYCTYAQSVNLGRAIPQVIDGLKPTPRKCLFTMEAMALWHDKPHRKVARISGEIAKVYIHGSPDGSLVGLGMPHANRYLPIEGQGNWGSVADSAAASRYIEARLSPLGEQVLLTNLHEGTVDWVDNYDGTCQEPTVLPARLPFLLLRDSSGMGVATACSHVSYNLSEVAHLSKAALAGKLSRSEDAALYVSGPDFASGGLLEPSEGLTAAMQLGRGSFHVRARLSIERDGDELLVVANDLPQDISPERVLHQTREAIAADRIPAGWIAAVRDETDRTGTRVIWELSRRASPEAVVQLLLRHTDCRVCISVAANAVAPDGLSIRLYGLTDVANTWATARRVSELSRQKYLLGKQALRLEIVRGLLIALRNIEAVTAALLAGVELIELGLDLSETQVDAIEAMQLRGLKSANRTKLEAAEAEHAAAIEHCRKLIDSPQALTRWLVADVNSLLKQFADERRTGFIGETEQQLALAGAKQLAALETKAAAPSHNGWLIDCRQINEEGFYYRQIKAKHPTCTTVDTAGIAIVAIMANGQIYRVDPRVVALTGKAHSIRHLIAQSSGQSLDPDLAVVWHSIVRLSEAPDLLLISTRADAAKSYLKRISLSDVAGMRRKPKAVCFSSVAILTVKQVAEQPLVTVEYASGAKACFDVAGEAGEAQAWSAQGWAMRNEAILQVRFGNQTGKLKIGHRRS